jgi:hypothetical protein
LLSKSSGKSIAIFVRHLWIPMCVIISNWYEMRRGGEGREGGEGEILWQEATTIGPL